MKSIKTKWIIIGIYIAMIYLSLPYMRSVLNYIQETIGQDTLRFIINGLLLGVTAVFLFLLRKKISSKSFLFSFVPILLISIFVLPNILPEERVHFIEYGLLAFLVFSATGRNIELTLFFVFTVGAVDEIIQYFLPNRVGDLRDVAINAIGGALGLWLRKLLH